MAVENGVKYTREDYILLLLELKKPGPGPVYIQYLLTSK